MEATKPATETFIVFDESDGTFLTTAYGATEQTTIKLWEHGLALACSFASREAAQKAIEDCDGDELLRDRLLVISPATARSIETKRTARLVREQAAREARPQ
jgi:hypothetical protein